MLFDNKEAEPDEIFKESENRNQHNLEQEHLHVCLYYMHYIQLTIVFVDMIKEMAHM